ncbi:family 43 glycosylhydrolase [Ruminococcus flavefaciens]|uniref:beta-xylosidase family glycoside hydrolase n=1 Tax=Ruminococcus flavefaciens TaxID=1265 RepID=UPI00048F528C|nr:family 43 glycosylhydrolase [Ruminococcus flavefaciens]
MKQLKLRRAAASVLVAAAVALPSITASSSLISTPVSAASTINNPIIWADVPDDDIIRVGDTYYMVSTTMFFSPGAPIMKSKDLANWEICNYVFDTYANGDVQNLKNGKHDYSHGQWATSLRYNEKKGKYYAFFGSYGSNKSYICSTDDIENGEWSRVELNGMYHDASILFDDDGRNYLVSGAGGTCSIKEFNSEMTGWKSGGLEKQLFKTNFNNLAGEGWHIQKINGYYYIFGIAWPSGHGRLEFVYRSKSLTGNWESKTILDSGLGSYGSGCAQGGIVDTPDGKWYGLLFQDHGAVGRIPVLVPVNWQNDWPMMGVNGKAPLTLDLGTTKGTDVAGDDSFDYTTNDLALEWSWNHNPDNSAWSVTERPGWLRLKNKNMASHLLNARNTLTMRTEGPACSSYIKLDASNMKPGDYAGLSAFQLKYGCIGVRVDDSGNKKVYMSVNTGSDVPTSSNKIVAEQNMNGNEVYLKVDFKFANVNSDGSSSNNIDKANFYYSYDGQNWNKLGQELSMSYDLKLFTGYRSGIYSYPTKSTGGYADIDFFEYDRQTWNGCNGSKVLSGTPVIIEPDENGYYFHNTFESGTESWTGRGSASVAVDKTEAYDGSGSLACTGRNASWNGASKSLSSSVFKAGEEYSFSTVVKYTEGPASQKFYLTLQYEANGDVNYDKIATVDELPKGEWVQLANTNYKIPEGASNLQMYVETDSDDYSFYVDEAVGGVAGTVVDGPKAVSVILGDVNGDEVINSFDIVAARKGLLSEKFADDRAKRAADVDKNGKVEMSDLVQIQSFVLGKISEFGKSDSQSASSGGQVEEQTASTKYTMAEYTKLVEPKVANKEPDSARQEKGGVQYGTVKSDKYFSTTCNREKPFNILLPANYDPNKKYPVMYIMHGYYENQDRMIIKGNGTMYTRQIIGNAIAEGEAEEMICVFPYIYSSATQKDCSGMDDNNNRAYDNFINDLTKDLMPYIEKNYSVKTGRDNTAITGFSMGGRESLLIGMKRPDLFGYIGAICPAPGVTGDFKWKSGEEPHLLFMTAGSNDEVVYTTPNGYHDSFTKNGVPHIWHYVNGGYHGDNSIHAHIYNFVRAAFKA